MPPLCGRVFGVCLCVCAGLVFGVCVCGYVCVCVCTSEVPNENKSLFMILLAKAPIHDNRYVVFGNVMSGLEVLRSVELLGSWKGDVSVRALATLPVCVWVVWARKSGFLAVVCCPLLYVVCPPSSPRNCQADVRIGDCGELVLEDEAESKTATPSNAV